MDLRIGDSRSDHMVIVCRNVQVERRPRESKWNSEHHFSSSLEDEVLVHQESSSEWKSLDLAHHLQTVSYELASGNDVPAYT